MSAFLMRLIVLLFVCVIGWRSLCLEGVQRPGRLSGRGYFVLCRFDVYYSCIRCISICMALLRRNWHRGRLLELCIV